MVTFLCSVYVLDLNVAGNSDGDSTVRLPAWAIAVVAVGVVSGVVATVVVVVVKQKKKRSTGSNEKISVAYENMQDTDIDGNAAVRSAPTIHDEMAIPDVRTAEGKPTLEYENPAFHGDANYQDLGPLDPRVQSTYEGLR